MKGGITGVASLVLKTVYDVLGSITALLMLPLWLVRDAREGGGTASRYGIIPEEVARATSPYGCLWLHAASVGEVGVLARVLPHLARLTPELPVVVTTVTSTGRDRARQLLGDQAYLLYLPLDSPPLVRRAVRILHPQMLVIAETELWPNLIFQAASYGAPVMLINGRLSVRAFWRYRLACGALRRVLQRLSVICVKSEADRDRFITLGASPDTVYIAGDLKSEPLFDVERASIPERRSQLKIPEERPVFTAGSTRQGEEPLVLEAFGESLKHYPDMLLVIAPRHPHRAGEVEELIRNGGWQCLRRTLHLEEGDLAEVQVLLLDTIGELESFYAASDIAFVGGSLIPAGGHNLLEPALYGVPVLFGPHTGETGAADQLLLKAGGGVRVENSDELSAMIVELLGNESNRLEIGRQARRAVDGSRGALDEVLVRYRKMLGLGISPVRAGRIDRGSRGFRIDDLLEEQGGREE